MTAHAQFEENVYQKSGIPYIDLVWDEVTATMYTTQKFVEADTKRVTASTTSLSEGWYVVEGEVMAASRITVSGTVHLILCDGADFQVEDGIQVHDGSSLYLYAQSEGTDMGMLKADGDEYQAGIGGGYERAGGSITINGGEIVASGEGGGAGIGGGYEGAGGSITINGGEIVASGEGGGAGIGGGDGGDRGSITINGGVVVATAEGSHSGAGAGIGGGSGSYEDEGNITINGGVVIARCGGLSGGAGIGASNYRAAGSVSIHGGEVSGTGRYGAAGISGAEGSIIITGGRVTATGYSDPYDGG